MMKRKTKVLGLALFALFFSAIMQVNAYDSGPYHGIQSESNGGCPDNTCSMAGYCLGVGGYAEGYVVCRMGNNGKAVNKIYVHGHACSYFGCDSTDGYGRKLYCMTRKAEDGRTMKACCYGDEEPYYNSEGDSGCRKKTSTVTATATAQKKCYFRPSNNVGTMAYDSGKEHIFYGYTYKCTDGTWSRVAKPYNSQYAGKFSCYNNFLCYNEKYYDWVSEKIKTRLWAQNINSGAMWYYNNRWIRA